MQLQVLMNTTVMNPAWQEAQDVALKFYDQYKTSHKLYTNPKTLEQVEVHRHYGKLVGAAAAIEKGEYVKQVQVTLISVIPVDPPVGLVVYDNSFQVVPISDLKPVPYILKEPIAFAAEEIHTPEQPEESVLETEGVFNNNVDDFAELAQDIGPEEDTEPTYAAVPGDGDGDVEEPDYSDDGPVIQQSGIDALEALIAEGKGDTPS